MAMPGDVSLKGIEFTIKGSTDSASASLDILVKKLVELRLSLSKISSASAVTALSRLQHAIEGFNTDTIRNVASAFKELGHTFAYMDASADAISALGSLSTALAALTKNTDKLDEAVGALTAISEVDYSGLQEASEGLKSLATASRAISKLSENPENIADVAVWLAQIAAIDFTNIETAAEGIRDIASAAKDIASIKPAAPAIKETGEAIKQTGEAAKKANDPLSNFVNSLKRIAFYRIIRGIIKSITEAFSEGLKNAYEFSKLTGGALSQALDTISTKSLTMKNQLGAAFGGLLTALTPIILTAINLITKLAAAISRLIAILGGGSQWMKAKDVWTEWGDAAAGAGGAAKEALRYLAPFDELNVLPDTKSGGGGGGGSDYAGMFEETTEFAEGLKDFADSIRAAIEAGDWQGLGEILGSKVNELIDKIDFAGMGAKVGGFINAWFTTKYWTLDSINFTNIGAKIADFLNNALGEIDFEIIGRSLVQKFEVFADTLIGFIENADWGGIASSIGDTLSGFFKEIGDWFTETDFAALADSIWNGVKDAVSSVDWAEVAQSIFRALGAAIGAAASFLTQLGKDIITDIWNAIKAEADSNGDGELTGKEIILGIWEGIKKVVSNAAQWIKDNIFTPFLDGIKNAFGIHSPASTMVPIGQNIAEGILSGIASVWSDIKNWLKANVWQPLVNAWNDSPEWTHLDIKVVVTRVKDWTTSFNEWITGRADGVITGIKAIIERAIGWKTKFKEWISGRSDGKLFGLTEMISRAQGWTSTFKKWISNRDDGKLFGLVEMVSRKTDWKNPFYKWISGRDDGKLFGLVEMISRETDWKNTFKKWISGRDDGKLFGLTEMISRAQGWTTTFREWISGRSDGQLFGLTEMIDLGRNGWSTVSSWVQNSFMGDIIGKAVNLIRNNWGTVYSWITEKYFGSDVYKNIGLTKTWLTVHDWVSQFIGDAVDIVANLVNPSWKYGTPTMDVNASVKGGGTSRALGGVYNNGVWRDIPQYASGTANAHGSLFVAGEAGPEVVGHIGGRTEVLNKSQIASAIYSATRSAMSNASMDNGVSEETMYRAFSRALADSDLGGDIELDGETLYRAMVNRNRANTRMTGVNAMA